MAHAAGVDQAKLRHASESTDYNDQRFQQEGVIFSSNELEVERTKKSTGL